MKEAFSEHFRPTEAEFDGLWKGGMFSFDSCVLLNLYGYSKSTRDDFLNVLQGLSGRSWLSRQAGEEFFKHRKKKILEQCSPYEELKREFQKTVELLSAEKKHPFVSPELLGDIEAIRDRLAKECDAEKIRLKGVLTDDPILKVLVSVFGGRVGDSLNCEELEKVCSEGERRYREKIPPGYKDSAKNENPVAKFGDLILWTEVIKFAKTRDTDVIFVTDDLKEDWFEVIGDERMGPRPELLREFRERVGKKCYLYSSEGFIVVAKQKGIQIKEATIDEVKGVAVAAREREKEQLLAARRQINKALVQDYKHSPEFLRALLNVRAINADGSPSSEWLLRNVAEHVMPKVAMEDAAKMAAIRRMLLEEAAKEVKVQGWPPNVLVRPKNAEQTQQPEAKDKEMENK